MARGVPNPQQPLTPSVFVRHLPSLHPARLGRHLKRPNPFVSVHPLRRRNAARRAFFSQFPARPKSALLPSCHQTVPATWPVHFYFLPCSCPSVRPHNLPPSEPAPPPPPVSAQPARRL